MFCNKKDSPSDQSSDWCNSSKVNSPLTHEKRRCAKRKQKDKDEVEQYSSYLSDNKCLVTKKVTIVELDNVDSQDDEIVEFS